MNSLAPWAKEMVALYEAGAASQFILYGNINDRVLIDSGGGLLLGGLDGFLRTVMLPKFHVVLTYDPGNGIRVEKGGEILGDWPLFKEAGGSLPKQPRPAIEALTRFFLYHANLMRLGKPARQIACIVRSANLIAPGLPGSLNYDLNALAFLMRDWANDEALTGLPLATFLLTDNLHDLHPLLTANPSAASIKIPLPSREELCSALKSLSPRFPEALRHFGQDFEAVAKGLAGITLGAAENLLKRKQHEKQPLGEDDLARLKKELVERDCNELIEFIEPRRNLDDLHGLDEVKKWVRQDIALWRAGDSQALPMGYLICGPVGTGKTFLVDCLAGEAALPVVKIRNFRDKWVGSTEGNLEKIFRLLQALGKCFVFIDEADQALGRRDSGANDSGLSGRVYAMFAKEMSDPENRGRILWVLASSRPDLIEVDLKRPGRIDVKIPVFPTATAAEGFGLICALCRRRGLSIEAAAFQELEKTIPDLLTPGAAEALAVRVYRQVKSAGVSALDALKFVLANYQPPVSADVLDAQIRIAVAESSDRNFVPERFRRE